MKRINITIILSTILWCIPFLMSFGQGARYTGSYTKSSAIQHVRKSNLIIEGLEISSNSQEAIALYDCENIIIRHNRFGPSQKRAIYLDNCRNITIIDNSFGNVHSALIAHNSQGIKFDYNDIFNVGGSLALSDFSNNGFVVLFDKVRGAGNSISYNVAENIFGDSTPGDLINVNQSHGTAQSPIIVKGNWLRGGGPWPSGGGILLGDLGGSYQIAEENILVDPGQYGMGIGGGHNIALKNNKVYAKRQDFTNVGFSIANWYESEIGSSYNITFERNAVNYTNKNGVSGNSWWIAGNVEPVIGKETNRYDPNLTASILPKQIIGRARAGAPSNPGEGSTPLPEEDPKDNEPKDPGFPLPDINNHPSITIYLDQFKRACINISGNLNSAVVLVADNRGNLLYQQPLTRFHTVLPNDPIPGSYHVYVKNGDNEHLKTLIID